MNVDYCIHISNTANDKEETVIRGKSDEPREDRERERERQGRVGTELNGSVSAVASVQSSPHRVHILTLSPQSFSVNRFLFDEWQGPYDEKSEPGR